MAIHLLKLQKLVFICLNANQTYNMSAARALIRYLESKEQI